MEIKINLDLPGIVADAVTAERIKPLVDKAISDAITEAINDATGYCSEFRNTLKKQLAQSLPHGLQIEDVAKFQLVANEAVTEAVHGANAAIVRDAITTGLKEMMPDVPERIKLSELLQKARDGFRKKRHESFYAHLKETDYGSFHLYLDSDSECFGETHAQHKISWLKDGTVYNLRLAGVDMTPKSRPEYLGDFASLLLCMYVGRTAIDVDLNGYDVESAANGLCD